MHEQVCLKMYIVLAAQHRIQLDISTDAIEFALSPLGHCLPCELCQQSLNECIQVLTRTDGPVLGSG